MNLADVKIFQAELARQIEELKMETNVAPGSGEPQIGDTLRTLLPVNGGSDVVMTEILVSEFNEDSNCLVLYTTMIMEIGPGYEVPLPLPEKSPGEKARRPRHVPAGAAL